MGLFLQEKITHSATGVLRQNGTQYHIPEARDVPDQFDVSLLKGHPNADRPGIYSSKGIGEPPLGMGVVCYHALKQAIYAARADEGLKGYLRVDAPLLPERARMACEDEITKATAAAAPAKVADPAIPEGSSNNHWDIYC
eukprot:TRINITY_DN32999_c0_g1_i1.p1 TRINITY_DN32999_c0_g1~~TRINITY_DN32999_c0_g1_i1.p1  ORF type:complete len:140 (+),score=55.98 TRINITY_DN32999_c0_g1_i1:356-775(+)